MIREIEFFEMRTIKIAGELYSVYKFKKEGTYIDGNKNKYVVYSTMIHNKKVTFLKNDNSLLCTQGKDYFNIKDIKSGDLDFYSWDIVTV